MFDDYSDILTVDEACEALRIGHNALYELVKCGKLKAFKNGRVWRIPKASIQLFIMENANINSK